MGLNSLPVAFGIDTAKWICVGTIDVTQVCALPPSLPPSLYYSRAPLPLLFYWLLGRFTTLSYSLLPSPPSLPPSLPPQLGVAGYLAYIGETNYALALLGLIFPSTDPPYPFLHPSLPPSLPQLGVAGYLAYIGETNYALALLGLILPQIFFQFKYFLKDPIEYDVKYQVRPSLPPSLPPSLALCLEVTCGP